MNEMEGQKLSNWQVVKSVLASFVGIQSRKNLERDASSNSMGRFVVIAIILAIAIHGLLYGLALYISWVTGVK
jgi:hypothetical protein|tara:strand:+ start:1468 stop:1686 length:219 start_codon:yes stop_codon:yes gene_type:complete